MSRDLNWMIQGWEGVTVNKSLTIILMVAIHPIMVSGWVGSYIHHLLFLVMGWTSHLKLREILMWYDLCIKGHAVWAAMARLCSGRWTGGLFPVNGAFYCLAFVGTILHHLYIYWSCGVLELWIPLVWAFWWISAASESIHEVNRLRPLYCVGILLGLRSANAVRWVRCVYRAQQGRG